MSTKDPIAQELGKRGGHARAAALSPERRREIAVRAGKARGEQKKAEKLARLG